MTNKRGQKFRRSVHWWFVFIVSLAGVIEALMLARLTARLLAARPENPMVMLLYEWSAVLVAPLAWMDRGQPQFGAVLEFSTLTLAIVVPCLAYGLWLLGRATHSRFASS